MEIRKFQNSMKVDAIQILREYRVAVRKSRFASPPFNRECSTVTFNENATSKTTIVVENRRKMFPPFLRFVVPIVFSGDTEQISFFRLKIFTVFR